MSDKFITSDKIFQHTEQLNNWKIGNGVKPITLELHLTNKCNNACYYCCMWNVKNAQEMTTGQVHGAVDFIGSSGAKGVILSGGGEPTMHKGFDNAVFWLEQKGLDVGVITNGVNWDEQRIKTVLPMIKWVRISLDAINDEQYKAIRGTHQFEQVVANIKKMLELKSHYPETTIGVQMVVNKHNYHTIREFFQFCMDKIPEIDYVQIRPLEIRMDETPYSNHELKEIFDAIDTFKHPKLQLSDKWDLIMGEREFGFTKCHCCEMIGTIDAYGDYYLCCHVLKRPEYRFFNIFSHTQSNQVLHKFDTLKALGPSKGLNPDVCPIGCRGSNINRRLEGLANEQKHKNFL